MLRQPVRSVRIPLKAFSQPTQQAAWNGAWRRLFTSQTGSKVPNLLWRRRLVQFENTFTRLRDATAPGQLRGALRRGFRFSARRKADVKAPTGKATQEPQSLSAKLKKLSKEYGWAAVAIYLGLSVLDFPFCFLFVRWVGTEKIGEVEHQVVSFFKGIIPDVVADKWHEYWATMKQAETDTLGNGDISEKVEMASWGVEKASERNKEEASKFIFITIAILKCYVDLGEARRNHGRTALTMGFDRLSDSAGVGLRHPQEFHLFPGAANSLGDAKDCQDFEIMGVEDWQEGRGLKNEAGEAEELPLVQLYWHTYEEDDEWRGNSST